jgi:hypothetical protein
VDARRLSPPRERQARECVEQTPEHERACNNIKTKQSFARYKTISLKISAYGGATLIVIPETRRIESSGQVSTIVN